MKYLFIDIRKSDEVYSRHFDQSKEYTFYNIPMNVIRFNVDTIIHHLEYVDEIYIVCQSSSRSEFIKNKYFKNYERIKVNKQLQFSNLNYGQNHVSLNKHTSIRINVIGSNSFNVYSILRITQIILGIAILTLGIYTYMQLKNKKLLNKINTTPLLILLVFGVNALINGLTSTCTVSTVFMDYLN